MQCNMEFGYLLSICSGTNKNLDRVGLSRWDTSYIGSGGQEEGDCAYSHWLAALHHLAHWANQWEVNARYECAKAGLIKQANETRRNSLPLTIQTLYIVTNITAYYVPSYLLHTSFSFNRL
jgi:hypothetical protein